MGRVPRALKAQLFTACAEKACCSHYTVHPTAEDVGRITTALELGAAAFCVHEPTDADDPDGFALGPDGERHRLALARRPRADGTAGECTFLLRTPDGSGRCGLGELRPMGCVCFPCVLEEGVVQVRGDDACTCRAWSLAEMDPLHERALLERESAERERYRELLREWNDNADASGEAGDFADFCAFLRDTSAPT